MPFRTVPNTSPPLQYYLLAFGPEGHERREPDGSFLSEQVVDVLRTETITDAFIMSHGWLGDVPSALRQYDSWVTNLMCAAPDVLRMQRVHSRFQPLLVGLHWPSEPWGDEGLEGNFSVTESAAPLIETIEKAAADQSKRLAGGTEVEVELRKIYHAYAATDSPGTLPSEIVAAYRRLDQLLGTETSDDGSALGADRPAFDPEATYQAAKKDEEFATLTGSFSALGWSSLLAPLRILSFWRMKNRARALGESGAHQLLRLIQRETANKDVRLHLMGHSFGCIVVTGMAAGPLGDPGQRESVHSIVLVQGALSLWAYCESMPHSPGRPGYFNRLIKNKYVEGPLVATLSQYDRAVGRAYPLAAGIAQQESFMKPDELPRYGGVGSFGIQGLDALTSLRRIAPLEEDYNFRAGKIYNLNSESVISGNMGQFDAHSDIVHPEVAHVLWQAAMPLS